MIKVARLIVGLVRSWLRKGFVVIKFVKIIVILLCSRMLISMEIIPMLQNVNRVHALIPHLEGLYGCFDVSKVIQSTYCKVWFESEDGRKNLLKIKEYQNMFGEELSISRILSLKEQEISGYECFFKAKNSNNSLVLTMDQSETMLLIPRNQRPTCMINIIRPRLCPSRKALACVLLASAVSSGVLGLMSFGIDLIEENDTEKLNVEGIIDSSLYSFPFFLVIGYIAAVIGNKQELDGATDPIWFYSNDDLS